MSLPILLTLVNLVMKVQIASCKQVHVTCNISQGVLVNLYFLGGQDLKKKPKSGDKFLTEMEGGNKFVLEYEEEENEKKKKRRKKRH